MWISTVLAGATFLLISQKLFFPYLWYDIYWFLRIRGIRKNLMDKAKKGTFTLLQYFLSHVKAIPNKPFIIFEGDVYTYGDVDRRSNRIAHVFLKHEHLKKGDTVAIMMSNEPEFICLLIGLMKIGCTVAFINSNIRSKSLLHCINTCSAKILVVGADIASSVEDIYPELVEKNIAVWTADKCSPFKGPQTLSDKLEDASDVPLPSHLHHVTNAMGTCLYLFTSGTTGFPKAAKVTHLRILRCASLLYITGLFSSDVIYVTTPLYHKTAFLLGIGGTIFLGATTVLKKKFSASQFWSDCKKHKITVFLYIGEICRYLCNQPKREEEKGHGLRLAVGTGMRPEVWSTFIERFHPVKVMEIYGSTEGNIGFINFTNKVGPIGRGGFFSMLLGRYALIKYDTQTQEAIRDKNGRCIKAKRGEPALLIAPNSKQAPFVGYAGNKELSESKLLRNVFVKGDEYFSTGDMMVLDNEDFIYFVDRTGDTFRWKGENVATTEVSSIISTLEYIEEANVYGVTVPGHEGRAGMAALRFKIGHVLDRKDIYKHIVTNLPSYAQPLFLRIQESIDVTSTYKYLKTQMVKDGFNPAVISDPLYILDNKEESYVPLTKSIYESILSCKKKL